MSGVPHADSADAAFAHTKAHIEQLVVKSPFYSITIPGIKLAAASNSSSSGGPAGRVTCVLEIQPHHLNSKNSLHGSLTATLVDFVGGVAIACADPARGHDTGVSLDISIQYIGGAKAGETIEIEGTAERVGGSVAFTRAVIRKHEGNTFGRGAMVATASHTKFVRRKNSTAMPTA